MTISEDIMNEVKNSILIRDVILGMYNSTSMFECQLIVSKAMLGLNKIEMIKLINQKVAVSEIGTTEPISLFQFACISGDYTTLNFLFENGGDIADKFNGAYPFLVVRRVALMNEDKELGVLSIKMEQRLRFVKMLFLLFIALFFIILIGGIYLFLR